MILQLSLTVRFDDKLKIGQVNAFRETNNSYYSPKWSAHSLMSWFKALVSHSARKVSCIPTVVTLASVFLGESQAYRTAIVDSSSSGHPFQVPTTKGSTFVAAARTKSTVRTINNHLLDVLRVILRTKPCHGALLEMVPVDSVPPAETN
jgi:hypothetical protein